MEKEMNGKANQTILYGIFLLIILIPLFCLGIANHGLWTADEPRVAEIGREMAVTGNWVVPMLNRKPFLEQPPLYYAAVAATFRIYGSVSDRVARLPSVFFAFGGCIALFFLGRLLFGAQTGFVSAVVLATSFEFFRVAHWLVVDSALTCFIIAAMALFMQGYRAERGGRKLLFYVLFYLSCGFAFFSKGFIGVAIPALAILVFLFFERNIRELLRMRLWLGICIFLAMTLPWFLGLWNQGGSEHLQVFLVRNHLQRFISGGPTGHHQPFYYYFAGFPEGFLPWSLLLVPVVYFSFWKSKGLPDIQSTGLLFLKCWFLAGFIFLSFASTKRILYLLPVFAPFAMLTAWYIDTTLSPRVFMKIEKVFLWIFGALPFLLGLMIIPVYLQASKGYPIISSTMVLSTAAVASALILVLSFLSLLYLYRREPARFWAWSGSAFFVILIFTLVTVMPALDQFKSFVPFCEQVKTMVKQDSPLYAYTPDETLRAIIPFYTGYYLKETDSAAYLGEAAARGDQIFVVIRDSKGRLEDELLTTGKFSVLFRQGPKTDRSLVLLTNKI
jgi:4-amino-4-deoxy-L-arabinose transferase-like glycosyltransferase